MFENILRIDPTLPKNLTTQQQMRKHKPPVEFIETKSNRAYSFQIKNVIKQLAKYVILLECPLIFFKTYNFLPDLPSRDNPDHYETFANMLNKSTEVLKIRTQMLTQARNVRQISDGYGLSI
ncbi:unnamed protein product [Rhizophagus irregularis]|nr:unnamed protein product [Rhizophagus irregularis]